MTSGNPFFVIEVLAGGQGDRVPSTVVDAVLARVRRLDPATQEALEQLAVVPSVVERWLVEVLVAGGLAALVAAEEHGLLTVSPASVAFRHELARRAVADSLAVARRVALHRRVLQALVGRGDADLSRIVHHAAEAGDSDAIVRHGPAAARDAAGAGAHREAVAHYRLVLGHRERFAPAELAELLEGYAVECYTIGTAEAMLAAQREAVELRRSLGDQRALGADLRWLSRMQYWAGDRAAAEHSRRRGHRRAGGGWRPPAARPGAQQPVPAAHAGLPHRGLRGGRRAGHRPGPRGGRRRDPVPSPDQPRWRAVAARRPGGMVADGGGPAGRAGRWRGRARLPRLHPHHLGPSRRLPSGRGRAETGGRHPPCRAVRPPRLPWVPPRGAGPARAGQGGLGRGGAGGRAGAERPALPALPGAGDPGSGAGAPGRVGRRGAPAAGRGARGGAGGAATDRTSCRGPGRGGLAGRRPRRRAGHRRPGLQRRQPRGLPPAPGRAGLLADQGGTGRAAACLRASLRAAGGRALAGGGGGLAGGRVPI